MVLKPRTIGVLLAASHAFMPRPILLLPMSTETLRALGHNRRVGKDSDTCDGTKNECYFRFIRKQHSL